MESKQTQKRFGEIAFLLACLAVASLFFVWSFRHSEKQGEALVSHSEEPVYLTVGETQYRTEIARTPEARTQGLGGRDTLCAKCAMLFVFEGSGQDGFWMKDMHFAIDILWLRGGIVVHKEGNVSPDTKETFRPQVVADSVLEILPNEAIQVGERVKMSE